jgi:hypothetical protein
MLWDTRRAIALTACLLAFSAVSLGQFKYTVTSYTVPNTPTDAVTGDFDRDGRPDFLVASPDLDRRLVLMRNTGNGAFVARVLSLVPGDWVAAADLNGDGKLDAVTPNARYGYQAVSLKTFLGNGDGTFHRGPDIAIGSGPVAGRLGDFNNDSIVDIAVLACTGFDTVDWDCDISLLLGNGDATYHSGAVQSAGRGLIMTATDFNRDGKLDVAVAVHEPSRAVVYFGDGAGGFSSSTAVVVNNPIDPTREGEALPQLADADFNDDGAPDLVITAGTNCGSACGASRGYIYLNSGAGNFTLKSTMYAAGSGGSAVTPFDYNNDFKQDLIFWNGGHFDGGYHAMQGRGDGTFFDQSSNLGGCCEQSLLVPRDLNLDSRHDGISASWYGSGSVEVGINTNNTFNCAPPNSATLSARFCTPGNNGTVASSFQVRASGNSPAGVKRLELWIDGTKRYQTWNDQIRRTVSLSAGTHRITVVTVDQYVGTAKTSISVNVQ